LDEFPGDWRIYKSNTNYLTISVDRFVPEPATLALGGLALAGAYGASRKRKSGLERYSMDSAKEADVVRVHK
jgi:hypothetical protein